MVWQREKIIDVLLSSLNSILPSVLIQLITKYIPFRSLLLVGGHDGQFYHLQCEQFNLENKTWKYFCSIPQPRTNSLLLQVNEKLCLIGGFNGIQSCRSVYLYNLSKIDSSWEQIDSLSISRIAPFGWTYKNKIYVFGGYQKVDTNNTKQRISSGELFSFETSKWIKLKHDLPTTKLSSALISLDPIRECVFALGYSQFLLDSLKPEYGIFCLKKLKWTQFKRAPLFSDTRDQNYTSSYHNVTYLYPWIYFRNNHNQIIKENIHIIKDSPQTLLRNTDKFGKCSIVFYDNQNILLCGGIESNECTLLNLNSSKLSYFPHMNRRHCGNMLIWLDLE